MMKSPSRRLTEFLSSYLDFDAQKMQLGLWNGNLVLENVNIKASAVEPWLNYNNAMTGGLQVKLHKGTVGKLKVRVSWASLATANAADVNVEISDVNMVLGFESEAGKEVMSGAQRSARRALQGSASTSNLSAIPEEEDEWKKREGHSREEKQRTLREAEDRRLKGEDLLIGSASDKHGEKNTAFLDEQEEEKGPPSLFFGSFFSAVFSSLYWRLFAGLKIKVNNMTITAVQDGVTLGLVYETMELHSTKHKDFTNQGQANTSNEDNAVDPTLVCVSKTKTIKGLAAYVMCGKTPHKKHYILHPTDYSLHLIMHRSPPSRSSPGSNDSQPQTTAAATATSATDRGGNTTPPRQRRGKRQKQPTLSPTSSVSSKQTQEFQPQPPKPKPKSQLQAHLTFDRIQTTLHYQHRQLLHKFLSSLSRVRNGRPSCTIASVLNTPTNTATHSSANISTTTKTPTHKSSASQNTVVTTLTPHPSHASAAMHSKRAQKPPLAPIPSSSASTITKLSTPLAVTSSTSTARTITTTPIAPTASSASNPSSPQSKKASKQQHRSITVRSWWYYAHLNVIREIKARRSIKSNFTPSYTPFDRNRQVYLKREYIELYLDLHFNEQKEEKKKEKEEANEDDGYESDDEQEESQPDSHKEENKISAQKKETLLSMEDELPIEQILLYRFIARKMKATGVTTLPPLDANTTNVVTTSLGIPKNSDTAVFHSTSSLSDAQKFSGKEERSKRKRIKMKYLAKAVVAAKKRDNKQFDSFRGRPKLEANTKTTSIDSMDVTISSHQKKKKTQFEGSIFKRMDTAGSAGTNVTSIASISHEVQSLKTMKQKRQTSKSTDITVGGASTTGASAANTSESASLAAATKKSLDLSHHSKHSSHSSKKTLHNRVNKLKSAAFTVRVKKRFQKQQQQQQTFSSASTAIHDERALFDRMVREDARFMGEDLSTIASIPYSLGTGDDNKSAYYPYSSSATVSSSASANTISSAEIRERQDAFTFNCSLHVHHITFSCKSDPNRSTFASPFPSKEHYKTTTTTTTKKNKTKGKKLFTTDKKNKKKDIFDMARERTESDCAIANGMMDDDEEENSGGGLILRGLDIDGMDTPPVLSPSYFSSNDIAAAVAGGGELRQQRDRLESDMSSLSGISDDDSCRGEVAGRRSHLRRSGSFDDLLLRDSGKFATTGVSSRGHKNSYAWSALPDYSGDFSRRGARRKKITEKTSNLGIRENEDGDDNEGNVLLDVSIESIRMNANGDYERRKTYDFSVGSITAESGDNRRLLSWGSGGDSLHAALMGHTSFKFETISPPPSSNTPSQGEHATDTNNTDAENTASACPNHRQTIPKTTIDNLVDIAPINITLEPCLVRLLEVFSESRFNVESQWSSTSSLYPERILCPFPYERERNMLLKLKQKAYLPKYLREVHSLFRLRGLNVVVPFDLVKEEESDDGNHKDGGFNNKVEEDENDQSAFDLPPDLINALEQNQYRSNNVEESGCCLRLSMGLMEIRNGSRLIDEDKKDDENNSEQMKSSMWTPSFSWETEGDGPHSIRQRPSFKSDEYDLESPGVFTQPALPPLPRDSSDRFSKSDSNDGMSSYSTIQPKSKKTEEGSSAGGNGSTHRTTNKHDEPLLNAEELVYSMGPGFFHHTFVVVRDIALETCSGTKAASAGEEATQLLNRPISAEILLSHPFDKSDPEQPDHQVACCVSPVELIISDTRLNHLSAAKKTLSYLKYPDDDPSNIIAPESSAPATKAQVSLPPRLSLLANYSLFKVNLSLQSFRVSIVKDGGYDFMILPSRVREIMFEESISDFLSQISCFDLRFPCQESIDAAMKICADRLSVLGFTPVEALECIRTARANFLNDVDLVKNSQSRVLFEMTTDQGRKDDFGNKNNMNISGIESVPGTDDQPIPLAKNPRRKYDQNNINDMGVFDEADLDASGTNHDEELSDDDSDESVDIIETTMQNAVEGTLTEFLPLLRDRPFDLSQRELLVFDVSGASASFSKLMYDQQFSASFTQMSARNGLGSYFLRVCPKEHEPAGQAKVSNLNNLDYGSSSERIMSSIMTEQTEDNDLSHIPGLLFSSLERDSGEEFGVGGVSVSVLASNDTAFNAGKSRKRERQDEISIGIVSIVFCEKFFTEANQILRDIGSSLSSPNGTDSESSLSADGTDNSTDISQIMTSEIVSCSIILTSDEFAPFSQIILRNISVEQLPLHSYDNGVLSSKTKVVSDCIRLLNLTPEGQSYPDIVDAITPSDGDDGFIADSTRQGDAAFKMELTSYSDWWTHPKELRLELDCVRVFLVRQYINELMQYLLSPRHGLGRFFKSSSKDEIVDANGNPPPPLQYHVTFSKPSVILPRDSGSKDMIALEPKEFVICNSFHSHSWSVPNGPSDLCAFSEHLENESEAKIDTDSDHDSLEVDIESISSDQSTTGTRSEKLNASVKNWQGKDSFRSTTSDTFHDCIDLESFSSDKSAPQQIVDPVEPKTSYLVQQDKMVEESDESQPSSALDSSTIHSELLSSASDSTHSDSESFETKGLSSHNKEWIPRITVQLEMIRIFTALGNHVPTENEENDIPRLRNFFSMSGRAEDRKAVYKQRVGSGLGHSGQFFSEVLAREWEEVTPSPVDLEVLVDWAPQLRILLKDRVTCRTLRPFNLDMRMSQFYLLLTVWYGNMQELPLMFPFTEEEIKDGATIPDIPPDWPEYGTDAFVNRLKKETSLRFEMALCFQQLHWHCSFDLPSYFPSDPISLSMMMPNNDMGEGVDSMKDDTNNSLNGIWLLIDQCVISIQTNDDKTLKVGCGASTFEILDDRKHCNAFPHALSVTNEEQSNNSGPNHEHNESNSTGGNSCTATTWADMMWGLDCGRHTLTKELPLPFQLTVFMTPDLWCLVNLGIDNMNASLSDLSPIWILLDYFGMYFKEDGYGYPYFAAEKLKQRFKTSRARDNEPNPHPSDISNANNVPDDECMSIDFRMWFRTPHLLVPSDPLSPSQPCMVLESTAGIFYRYKSVGLHFSSQEIYAKDLALVMLRKYLSPAQSRGLRWRSGADVGVRTLVEGLSIAVNYEFDIQKNHMKVAVCAPLAESQFSDDDELEGIESPAIAYSPLLLKPPVVCRPAEKPRRHLGTQICDITLSPEYMKLASTMLANFVGPNPEEDTNESPSNGNDDTSGMEDLKPDSTDGYTFTVSARFSGIKMFISAPLLGNHLPLAVVCLPSLVATASLLPGTGIITDHTQDNKSSNDLQVALDMHVWANYFKRGVTRSWEPLIEPYNCLVLYEKSNVRGQGITFKSESPFHLNITGALLETLDDGIDSFSNPERGIFGSIRLGDGSKSSGTNSKSQHREAIKPNDHRGCSEFKEQVVCPDGQTLNVIHRIQHSSEGSKRVAFSLMNYTGNKIRIHQQQPNENEATPVISYLKHLDWIKLNFPATVSIIKNLKIIEVPFERGLQENPNRVVDVQIPGFKWLRGISVDVTSTRFNDLYPRTDEVMAKISKDWRLKNAVKLLTEVVSVSGGQQMTLRSPFEIVNKTSHALEIVTNPNPRQQTTSPTREHDQVFLSTRNDATEQILPNDSYYVPLLLLESSLHFAGNHLGSFWVRPDQSDPDNRDLFGSLLGPAASLANTSSTSVEFCSHPVQLAKIVHESSELFDAFDKGREVFSSSQMTSGVHISCPMVHACGGASAAPFCYVVEIRRNLLLRQESLPTKEGNDDDADIYSDDEKTQSSKKDPQQDTNAPNAKSGKTKRKRSEEQNMTPHPPVAYSLVIHPPLIIENLLPESGRFELMHAKTRSILWWADLRAGESIPVHTVGLDAPIVLLLNLGFCRTPVGEGALIHHGGGGPKKGIAATTHAGINLMGKVVKASKGTVKKTFTTITETSEERGIERVAMVQGTSPHKGDHVGNQSLPPKDTGFGYDTGNESADVIASIGKINEETVFAPDQVSSETMVVDSVGQRLVLRINNVLGDGGQRHVTLYCPFWIVNTTEHALAYKQEKGSCFVSGTVMGKKDGSKPVDGSSRNYVRNTTGGGRAELYDDDPTSYPNLVRRGTIFPGTPGALASSPGNCTHSPTELVTLMNKDLPLPVVARISSMFNFQQETLVGRQKLCVQLVDATGHSRYTSDWSSGFTLDSVGIKQIVSMHCKDGRGLELSLSITVAPGKLGKYTKIIRFSNRYVLVNCLRKSIRLWQDNSLLHATYASGDRESQLDEENNESSKWHEYKTRETSAVGAINQYECLFGGSALLDEKGGTGIVKGTTAHRSALYIATAGPSDLIPFHLPDTRADRQLRIDFGGGWNLSSSFPADITGEHALKITRAVDLRLFRHVTTRAAPQYMVILPPPKEEGAWDGELGVWFETDWGGGERIVVKGTRRGKYSFNSTDIHEGDELLYIDDMDVAEMSFEETMKILKDKLAALKVMTMAGTTTPGNRTRIQLPMRKKRKSKALKRSTSDCSGPDDISDVSSSLPDHKETLTLTFRTLEERMRRVRAKALKARRFSALVRHGSIRASKLEFSQQNTSELGNTDSSQKDPSGPLGNEKKDAIKIEIKALNQSIYFFIRPFDPDNPPYRIENRSVNNFIYFRQRNCDGHPWGCLCPGESGVYTWEEPMKPKKLTVRVGANEGTLQVTNDVIMSLGEESLQPYDDTKKKNITSRAKQFVPFRSVDNEEEGEFGPSKTVKIEEIGFHQALPCPRKRGARSQRGPDSEDEHHLHCLVDTEGATRVLIISDGNGKKTSDEEKLMEQHLYTLGRQIQEEESNRVFFEEMKESLLILKNVKKSGSNTKSLAHNGASRVLLSPSDRSLKEVSEDEKEEIQPTNPEQDLGVGDVPLLPALEDSVENKSGAAQRYLSYEEQYSHLEYSENLHYAPDVENRIQEVADYPEGMTIMSTNQVIVEVLEAAGLRASDLSGLSNPFCEITLNKAQNSHRKNVFTKQRTKKRRTYFIEKTLYPKWSNQVFVFDVPPEAAEPDSTRGYSLTVGVRSYGLFKKHGYLGEAEIHLRSLRNQKELVGWYPLVGRTGRNDLNKATTGRARGSIRLRAQWIYSVTALLDYYLLLSELRLYELQKSKDGMKAQLSRVKKATKKRKDMEEMQSLIPMPRLSHLTKHQQRNFSFLRRTIGRNEIALSGIKKTPPEDNQQQDSKRKSWSVSTVRHRMRVAREKSLTTLYHQTEESRRIRRQEPHFLPSPISKLDNFADSEQLEILPEVDENEQDPSNSEVESWDFTHGMSPSAGKPSLLSHSDRSFLKRVRTYSRGDSSGECNSLSGPHIDFEPCIVSDDSINSSDSKNGVQQVDFVNYLFRQGLLCHVSEFHFHHLHWTHNFRTEVSVLQPSVSKRSDIKVPPSISLFKSWIIAQTFLNDKEVAEKVTNGLSSSLTANANMAATLNGNSTENIEGDKQTKTDLLKKESRIFQGFRLPPNAPTLMHERAYFYANELVESRCLFERAAKLSLKSVLNPGGMLTIRPITALNLPDTYHGMFVKLRYGTINLYTNTVDCKVTPTWTTKVNAPVPEWNRRYDEGMSETRNGEMSLFNSGEEDDIVLFNENDLPISVKPLQTSGFLRLSVVGERHQGKSKVELGVLQIPLSAALDCCNEVIEDHEKGTAEGFVENGYKSDQSTPMYIRWFPLQNPTDTIPIEGDMGQAKKSAESERERDNLFNQYYTPCIKLALIWKKGKKLKNCREDPDEFGDEDSNSTSTEPRYQKLKLQSDSYFHLSIGSISCALIDSYRPLELLSLHINDFDIRYSVTKMTTWLGAAIGWVQLDNQEGTAQEPVVFSPTPTLHPQPMLIIEAAKDNFRSKTNIDSYHYIDILLQEIDLRLEESWIFAVWEFYVGVHRRREVKSKDRVGSADRNITGSQTDGGSVLHSGFSYWGSDANATNPLLDLLNQPNAPQADQRLKKIYIQNLNLGSVRLNLSYIKSMKSHRDDVDTMEARNRNLQDGANKSDASGIMSSNGNAELLQRWSENSQNTDIWAEEKNSPSQHNIPDIISAVFPSITDAPVRMQRKLISHVFETPWEIVESLRVFYTNEILRQIYKIVGSLDFVGNPTMVLNSFMAGVRDFFLQPSRELVRSPKNPSRVGVGILKGTLSLVSHSATGIFGFTSKMSATAGQAAAAISLDKQFKRWHQEQAINNAKRHQGRITARQHFVAMLTRPLQDIFAGAVFAASGIVVEPYRGAKKGGKKGLAKGVAIGTIGLVTKPLVGVFDAFAHFTESIHDIAKNVNILERRLQPVRKLRLSYVFGVKDLLLPFNSVDARSQKLLHEFPLLGQRGKHIPVFSGGLGLGRKGMDSWGEVLILSEVLRTEPGLELYSVVTTKRIVLFKIKMEGGGQIDPSIVWQIELNDKYDTSSSLENKGHNGVVLYILQRTRTSAQANCPYNSSNAVPMSPPERQGTKEASSNSASFSHESYNFSAEIDGEGSNNLFFNPQSNQLEWDNRVTAKMLARQVGTGAQTNNSSEEKKGDLRKLGLVKGEFRHRPEMARIHNAICCLSGDFDALIFESGIGKEGTEGSTEGYTSFGHLCFEKDETSITTDEVRQRRNICTALESVAWLHEHPFVQDVSPSQQMVLQEVASRKAWRFADELDASRQEGGPDWLIQARARAMFVALPLPPIPAHIDSSDDVIAFVACQLKMGLISAEKAGDMIKVRVEEIAREPRQSQSDETTEACDESEGKVSALEVNHDLDEASPLPKAIDTSSQESDKHSNSRIEEHHTGPTEKEDIFRDESSTQQNDTLVESRLERLEILLGDLVQSTIIQNETPFSARSAPVRLPVIPSAGESDISALPSFGGASAIDHGPTRQRGRHLEREIRAQIRDLERQLAEIEGDTTELTASETLPSGGGKASVAKKVRRMFKKKKKQSLPSS